MAPRKPDLSTETRSSPTELVWQILDLLSLDPLLAFAGADDEKDTIEQLLLTISSLAVGRSPTSIRDKATKTNVGLIHHWSEIGNIVQEGRVVPPRVGTAM